MGIKVTALTYYRGTEDGDLEWVGYESKRRVLRYSLEATGAGATSLKLVHKYKPYYDAANGYYKTPELCVHLSTDSEAFINAKGTENGYLAKMVKDTSKMTYTVSLENLKLYPGQKYYLWVYPMTDEYAFAFCESGEENWELTALGCVSVALIGTNTDALPYLATIWNGTEWEVYVQIIWDGTSWRICSKEE